MTPGFCLALGFLSVSFPSFFLSMEYFNQVSLLSLLALPTRASKETKKSDKFEVPNKSTSEVLGESHSRRIAPG